LIDIALAAGFSQQSHFTKTFKKLTGVTPNQYRISSRLR
jgi:AraC family transcriptional regulator